MQYDWIITNHGNIFTFAPISEEARAHGEAHFPDDCQRYGEAYVVEHRFAAYIANDLLEHGFTLGPTVH